MRWLAVVTLALCALAGGWAFGGFGRLAGASSSDPWRTIERVSVASDGSQGNGDSGDPTLIIGADHPAISADGRYVAFASGAANLVPGDTNTCGFGATIGSCPDVFVHDRQTGTTERVSVASDGSQGNGRSDAPSISADGRYVAFGSFADNLVQGDTNTVWDVFVHDRQTGTTERVSVASNGSQGDDASYAPAISADGRYVAFWSAATNLVLGDTNPVWDVFVHDRQTGTTERVSVASNGSQGDFASYAPAISADGRYVAFGSGATNLVPGDTNTCAFGATIAGDCPDVFVHDRQTGTTERVSVASNGSQGDDASYAPAISADGRYVAFWSGATNLVPGDTNRAWHVFVHDRQTRTTERVGAASDGYQGTGRSDAPSISADGRYVAFWSEATNLVPGDTNTCAFGATIGSCPDIFVHDRQTGTTERVNVASDGSQGNSASYAPAISADGRYVAFDSFAYNLVQGDTNADEDVFVAAYQGMLQGDVDCSGSANALDALQLVLYAASLTANQSPGCPAIGVGVRSGPPLFGDVDCDGDVTAVDAAKILRFAANLSVAQNPGCPAIGASLAAG